VSGQGNAILLGQALESFDYHALVLNPREFRHEQAERLGLERSERIAWAKERRVCQVVRFALPDGQRALIANLHATRYARMAETELVRAAGFFLALARPDEIDVFAGDLNVRAGSEALSFFAEQGFSGPGQSVDHVLVRGATSSPPKRWPEERRRIGGVLVSDHAPLEVRIT
jgi:endonuclease/exonuclease/phosphatase (EEP) superfamily protein YafD